VGIKHFDAFLANYYPEGNREDNSVIIGYNFAQTIDPCATGMRRRSTRENIYEAGRRHQGSAAGRALARHYDKHSATDFAPIKQFQLRKFRGERWESFGDVIVASSASRA